MNSNRRNKSQNWGSSFIRTKISRQEYLEQKRTIRDIKYWEWLFIVISVFGVLVNIGFNGYQLTMNIIEREERYLFPILLIVTNLFAIYFLLAGTFQERPFQILMQLITKCILWIFNMIYFLTPRDDGIIDETEDEIKAIRFYISSAMLFLILFVGGFVMYQYWSSNLALFKAVGTEPKYVGMCKTLYLGNSLIALDAEITIVALILVASRKFPTSDLFALIVLPLGLVFTGFWVFIGHYAIQKENRYLTYFFYFTSHLQPLYVIYLVVSSSQDSVGRLLFFSIIFVGILFFVTHISLLVTIVKIQLNYDKGLKQAGEIEMARSRSQAQSLAGSAEYLDTKITYHRPVETDI